MGFKLKQEYEVFMVVDGPFAGHTYRHGVVYDSVPPQEAHKFDPVGANDDSPGQQGQKGKKKTLEPLNTSTLEPSNGGNQL